MIPKIIHYCWFGNNPKPEAVEKCIESWQTFCPSYKIIEWNESNYDIYKHPYVLEAYEEKKWAFVSDYARLDIIYNYGGIYLDTDVELIKSLDPLLKDKIFFGTEHSGYVATGLGFGAEKENNILKLLLAEYNGAHFRLGKGIYDQTPCPYRNTNPLVKMGFVFSLDKVWIKERCVVYPPEYFCPINYESGCKQITSKTYSIHHYSALWVSEAERELNEKIEQMELVSGPLKALFLRQIMKYTYQKKNGEVNSFFQFLFRKIIKKIRQY